MGICCLMLADPAMQLATAFSPRARSDFIPPLAPPLRRLSGMPAEASKGDCLATDRDLYAEALE